MVPPSEVTSSKSDAEKHERQEIQQRLAEAEASN
jgi:hypothetical protein